MVSYELPANANEDVLKLKIDEVQGELQSLNLSNCIVAQPASLLSLLARLQNLQTLSCVACPLKASLLLDRILRSLPNLAELEFSLVDGTIYVKEELVNIRHLARVHKGENTRIRKMYVEVAEEDNMALLRLFLGSCPLLSDIHVHFTHYVLFESGTLACTRISQLQPALETFTFTSEAPSTSQWEPPQPLDFQYCVGIHGNVLYRLHPPVLSCTLLRDLASSTTPRLPLEPVVLIAIERPHLDRYLLDAGPLHKWDELQSLCLALYARSLDETVFPAVDTKYDELLRDFFARLSNLVELNVSLFHFGEGIDFTELLALPALQRLRALSLPPCGIRHSGAVRRLAVGIGEIEELDIRLNLDGRHKRCPSCETELTISPADASAFRLSSGRLTFSNVRRLTSLEFLQRLQVSHLRFIDDSTTPRFDYRALAGAVRHNDTVRSLVVKFPDIHFGEDSFKSSLCPAKALEHLCLLTKSEMHPEVAEEIIQSMAAQLPSISYLHIHYVDTTTSEPTTVTWIRLCEDSAQSQRGKVLQGKPCIMCSTQTFVALSKPRSRVLQ